MRYNVSFTSSLSWREIKLWFYSKILCDMLPYVRRDMYRNGSAPDLRLLEY